MNKIIRLFLVAIEKINVIMRDAWQRSSVVEQRNHNPLVGGPNPSAATRISRCSGIFYLVKLSNNLIKNTARVGGGVIVVYSYRKNVMPYRQI